jgi:peptidoglycan biosynthesis protein MviN/MurJ (putative lipid II flippase)
MSKHEAIVSYVQWIGVITKCAIGLVSAIFFGAIGLAVSSTVTNALITLALYILTRRRLGLRTHLTLGPELRLLRSTPA